MFWKKRNDNIIDFSFDSDNKRQAYRVTVPEDFAATLTIKDHSPKILSVNDFSCGGFSFNCEEGEVGGHYPLSIRLPGDSKVIETEFEILSIDQQGVGHCHFLNLTEKDVKRLYQYVLEVQKQQLR